MFSIAKSMLKPLSMSMTRPLPLNGLKIRAPVAAAVLEVDGDLVGRSGALESVVDLLAHLTGLADGCGWRVR